MDVVDDGEGRSGFSCACQTDAGIWYTGDDPDRRTDGFCTSRAVLNTGNLRNLEVIRVWTG